MNARVGRAKKRLELLSLTWISQCLRFFSAFAHYRIGVTLGGILGLAVYYVLSRERKRTLAHLSRVFHDKDPAWIRRTAKRCFIHLGKALLEVMLMTPDRLARVVEIRGLENLRSALSLGKGVVYVTGHIGNWELMGHAVAAQSSLSVVAAPIKPDAVNDMIIGLRAGMGVKTILRGRPGASRELIRVFKHNKVLGILIDQDTDVESAFIDFMGRPAWTPTGAASMAIKFGAPIIFGYVRRERDNRHTVTIEGPLDLVLTGDDGKDILATTTMLNEKMEDCIMKNPEQWVWMHRRWRRQP
jgi:KDO2-lipid IV(A) lauroyltransferase